MRSRVFASMGAIAAVIAGVLLAPGCAADQAPGAVAKAWVPPRTPDGQPDLQGTWTGGAAGRPLERPSGEPRPNIGPDPGAGPEHWYEAIPPAPGSPGTPLIVEPADGKIPYQPWALERRNYIRAHMDEKWEYLDTRARCLPPGVPRVYFPGSYSDGHLFLQSPGQVVMLSEWNHQYRIIPLDGRPHPGQDIHLWMGDSRGHWEGNTLVVDVTNFTDKTWLDKGAEFHSEALHVIERFTIVDADTISYEATLEDPKVFTRLWRQALPLKRAKKGYELLEYACHEGNRAAGILLSLKKGVSRTMS